ncbi:ABC transporter substrate-binding protein [Rhizobium sp. 22-785-1]
MKRLLAAFSAGLTLWGCGAAIAQDGEKLSVLCAADEAWCAAMQRAYELRTGVQTIMVRKSTGEVLDQIRREKDAPTIDVWWGGTGDTHLQAASENLLEAYLSPHEAELLPWAQNFFSMSGGQAAGIYAGALGFAYNRNLLETEGLPAPTCWKDLISDAYRGKIMTGNPNYSGTAFTTLATLVQLFGEDDAFLYMKALDRNVAEYTKAGSAPVKAAARGEALIGISFMHDAVTQKEAGAPLVIVAPCEGTGYEIGAVSIVRGTKNRDEARRFVNFALSPAGQATGAAAGQNQVPSNAKAALPSGAPDLSIMKMVDYDFATFGTPEERGRLLLRFDTEVHPPSQ